MSTHIEFRRRLHERRPQGHCALGEGTAKAARASEAEVWACTVVRVAVALQLNYQCARQAC